MEFLFLGIIIGIASEKYLFRLLDLLFEYINVRISEKASKYQAKMQILEFKLNEKCSPKQPAIGFSLGNKDDDLCGQDDWDDEEEEISEGFFMKGKSQNKIGF